MRHRELFNQLAWKLAEEGGLRGLSVEIRKAAIGDEYLTIDGERLPTDIGRAWHGYGHTGPVRVKIDATSFAPRKKDDSYNWLSIIAHAFNTAAARKAARKRDAAENAASAAAALVAGGLAKKYPLENSRAIIEERATAQNPDNFMLTLRCLTANELDCALGVLRDFGLLGEREVAA
jgi:hypothetical protein